MAIQIKSKDVKEIIKATFPKYRKRKVYIEATEKITFSDLNWSGGTKAEYHACTIDGNFLPDRVNMGMPAPWCNPYEGASIQIPQGNVIVEGGYFCGHERVLTIYCNPADMPKHLTI